MTNTPEESLPAQFARPSDSSQESFSVLKHKFVQISITNYRFFLATWLASQTSFIQPSCMQYILKLLPLFQTYTGMSAGDYLLSLTPYPDPNSFLPDRWATTDTAQFKRMETAFVPFGRGSRMCIGLKFVLSPPFPFLPLPPFSPASRVGGNG